MQVNPCKKKQLTNMRAASKDATVVLNAPVEVSRLRHTPRCRSLSRAADRLLMGKGLARGGVGGAASVSVMLKCSLSG